MNFTLRAIAVLVFTSLAVVGDADEQTSDLIQMGAYVASDDMEASERFYRALFDREPIIKLENFVAFEVAGGIFAVAKRDVYAPGSSPGAGAVPYIHSTDLVAVQGRIKRATGEDAPEIIVEPGIKILKVMGPEGQLIEFFSLVTE